MTMRRFPVPLPCRAPADRRDGSTLGILAVARGHRRGEGSGCGGREMDTQATALPRGSSLVGQAAGITDAGAA